jgi:uncharacterized membrane protein YdjX (TVP38/TMEM64 family)
MATAETMSTGGSDLTDAVGTGDVEGGHRGGAARLVALCLVLAAAVAAVQFSPVGALVRDVERVRAAVGRMGAWAYPAVLLGSAVLVGCGFPRLVLCGVASAVLGVGWGLGLTQGGAVLGYYVVFCFVRWGGGDWVIRRRPRLRAVADTIQDQGVAGVVLARQIPLHGTLINLCLGLSRVRHRHFLIGTAVGLFPEAVPVALVSAGLVKGSVKESAGMIGLAAIAMAAVWVIGAYLLRQRARQRRPVA